MPSPPKRDRLLNARAAWKRRVFRGVVRLSVGLFLLAALILVWAWFRPVSAGWIDKLFENRLARATGLPLKFDRVELTIGRREIRIVAPALFDPETQETLLELTSLKFIIPLRSLAMVPLGGSKRVSITQVIASGPGELEFEERDGQITAAEPLRRAYTLIRDYLESRESETDLSLETVVLNGVNVRLDSFTGGERQAVIAIESANVTARFDGGARPVSIDVFGYLQGRGGSTGFDLNLRPNSDFRTIDWEFDVHALDSEAHILADLASDFRTGPLDLDGQFELVADGVWAFSYKTKIPSVTLVRAGVHGLDQTFEGGELAASLRWDANKKLLDFTVDFESDEADLKGHGRVDLIQPYHYSFHAESLELRGQGLALVERQIFGEDHITKPDEGKFSFRGEVQGEGLAGPPSSITGDASIEGVTVALRALPEPVEIVRFPIVLTTTTLTLNGGLGIVQGIPIRLSGTMQGSPVERKVERAEIQWETAGEVSGLSDLLAKAASGPRWDMTFRGDILTSGTLIVEHPTSGDLVEILDSAEIDGWLKFNRAEVSHRKLKEPIRNLSGTLRVSRKSASLRNLTGSVGDVDFLLNGTVTGPEHFWEDAFTSLTLESSFSLKNLPSYFAWVDADLPELPAMEGRATVEADISGPLDDWRSMDLNGELTVEDFALLVDTMNIQGTLLSPRLDLKFSPEEIRVAMPGADFEGLNLRAEGTIGLNEGKIQIHAEGPMTDFQNVLPRILGSYETVGGSAVIEHTYTVRRVDGPGRQAKSFVELLPEALRADFWSVRGAGNVRLENAEFLYGAAPTDARLTGIYGDLSYNKRSMWTIEPLDIRAGRGAANNRLAVTAVFADQGESSLFDFKLTGGSVNLDDWLQPWRKLSNILPDLPEPSPIRITVSIDTNEVEYRGLRGREFSGRAVYEYVDSLNSRQSWSDFRARLNQGSIYFDQVDWTKERGRLAQHYDIRVVEMDVADLLHAAYERAEGGLATGVVTGNLELHREGFSGTPFQGEGTLLVHDSRFVSNAVFSNVGGLLNLEELFDNITFTTIQGDFEIIDGAVVISAARPMKFENPSAVHPLSMEAQGTVGPARKVDLVLSIQFFPLIGEIPIFREVWGALTKRIWRYSVVGTLDRPNTTLKFPVLP